jgi:hypothetical protein
VDMSHTADTCFQRRSAIKRGNFDVRENKIARVGYESYSRYLFSEAECHKTGWNYPLIRGNNKIIKLE